MNNSISYIGDVNIKQIHKGIVISDKDIHNAGSDLLFKFLCSALCSNNEAKNFPHYLDMVAQDVTSNKYVSILDRRVQIAERIVISEDNIYKASLQTTIPVYLIKNKDAVSGTGYELRLYSDGTSTSDNYLANVTGAALTLDDEDVIVITWKMYFSNVATSTKEENNGK